MNSMIIKRVLIFSGLAVSLITLELTSEESLLMQLPTYEEVVESLIDKQEQENVIPDPVYSDPLTEATSKEQQIADYQELFSNQVRHTFIISFEQEEWDSRIWVS